MLCLHATIHTLRICPSSGYWSNIDFSRTIIDGCLKPFSESSSDELLETSVKMIKLLKGACSVEYCLLLSPIGLGYIKGWGGGGGLDEGGITLLMGVAITRILYYHIKNIRNIDDVVATLINDC